MTASFEDQGPQSSSKEGPPPVGPPPVAMRDAPERLDTDDLEAVLRADDRTAQAFLRLLPHPADVVEALQVLPVEEWPRILRLVPDESERAEVVALLDEGERSHLLDLLEPDEIGRLVREMPSDDAADIVEELEPEERQEALDELAPIERAQVEALLTYAPDTAGGIMQIERAQVARGATVDEAVARVRALAEDGIEVHSVFVVDEHERLIGQIPIVNLLLNRADKKVTDLVEEPVARVTPDVDQEEVAQLFRKYDLLSLPVVSPEGKLLGRILFDDVVDVVHEEADEDALRQGGTSAEELLYRDKVLPIARVRLPWLGINLVGSMFSAYLLHLYEPVIEQAIIIAAFVPVITAMGGNVGTQSATILTRGFATDRVNLQDVPRLLFKEFRVGVLMGLICGACVGVLANLVFARGHWMLGVVVFGAMVCAMTAAASVGTLAPAAMKRFGIDPAIASGPFVTTANDIIGIVIYMSTAMFFLEHLH
jgi:magnesium transporter